MKVFGHTVLALECEWRDGARSSELYRLPKGAWLLCWEDDDEADAQVITHKRAMKLLERHRQQQAAA